MNYFFKLETKIADLQNIFSIIFVIILITIQEFKPILKFLRAIIIKFQIQGTESENLSKPKTFNKKFPTK
jgi:hypothetical protein